MSLFPFILGGCGLLEDDEVICKEQLFREAMPLIAIPSLEQRITTYQEIIDKQMLSLSVFQANSTLMGTIEEQKYILDLSSGSATEIEEYRKIYSLTNGKLNFLKATDIRSLGFDTTEIFGSLPDDKIGILQLTTQFLDTSLNVPETWRYYCPENLNLSLAICYFNFDWDKIEVHLKSLIECYVSQDFAKEIFSNNGVTIDNENWQNQYYDQFLINKNFFINVSGGDIIGEADKNIPGSADNIYRLSMLLLEITRESATEISIKDFSPQLNSFIKAWCRIPTARSDLKTIVIPSGSMAGHPVFFLHTGIPVLSSRVDLADQSKFAPKNSNVLAIDPDQIPNAFAYKHPPSSTQQEIIDRTSISFPVNEFKVFNPDGVSLELTATPGTIQLNPNSITTDLNEVNVLISAPSDSTSAQIQIIDVASNQSLQELNIEFFDCVLVPLKFWKLKLEISGQLIIEADDVDANIVLQSANRIMGEQANVYLYSEEILSTVTITSESRVEQQYGNRDFDIKDDTHQQEIQTGIKESGLELNVIWTWDLRNFLDSKFEVYGMTVDLPEENTENFPDFTNPYILIEVTDKHTDEGRGRILAHEFGHWISVRNKVALTLIDKENFDHDDKIDFTQGHDEYGYNFMLPSDAEDHTLITIEQARILNQYARKIKDSNPHIN